MPEYHESETEINIDVKGGSFKEIVMIHLSRITLLSSVELRGGYFTITDTKEGNTKEIYIGDSREALSNAIYCLAQLLLPVYDNDMMTVFQTFKEDNKNLKETFLNKTKLEDTEVLGEGYYEDNEKPILETYKITKLNLYRELFTELSKLLSRRKYLTMGGTTY